MKKQLALLFAVFISVSMTAQTYRQQFDKLDQTIYKDDVLNRNNFSASYLHNVTTYLMRSY